MKVSELTKKLDYDFWGVDREITGIAYWEQASKTDIAIAFQKSEIEKTQAEIILTRPIVHMTDKTLIMVSDRLDLAMIKVCRVLMNKGILPDYSMPAKPSLCSGGYYVGQNCCIDASAIISPGAVLGNDIVIEKNCIVESFSVIGSGTWIGESVHISAGSRIGADSFYHYKNNDGIWKQFTGCGRTVIGRNTHIGYNTVIQRGTLSDTEIGESCMIGNMVDIGHDVRIGNNCRIVSQSGIAGNSILKNNVHVLGQVGIGNHIVLGNNVTVKAKSLVSKSVADNHTVFGLFGRDADEELKLNAKIRRFFNRKEGKNG